MLIRPEDKGDVAAIGEVHRKAFGRVAEAALVDRLRDANIVVVSLVAEDREALAGHILFSRLPIHTGSGVVDAVALAPLAVVPERQRQGIGSMLVRRGLGTCHDAGETIVLVLGHPHYYSRFGFSAGLTRTLNSPYSGEAFMALELMPGALAGVVGDVRYPAAFG